MLLELAIGDAYGASYEFFSKNREDFQKLDFTKYIENPNGDFSTVSPGNYTDDTQMSIAIAELLLCGKGYNKENLAESFVRCYKRDPIPGYAGGFQKFLDFIGSGEEFLEKIKPYSERNGAAMRSLPLGFVKDPQKVIDYAKINASLTHDTPKGIASSVAIALMAHYNIYNKGLDDLNSHLFSEIKNIDVESFDYFKKVKNMRGLDSKLLFGEKDELKGVPCDGMRTVGAVMHILSNYSNAKDVLLESVKLGGDTDSTASIALGLFSINNKIDDLPEFLSRDLINNKYGKDYLINLDEQLKKKFNL